jgi:hypothetical protein
MLLFLLEDGMIWLGVTGELCVLYQFTGFYQASGAVGR